MKLYLCLPKLTLLLFIIAFPRIMKAQFNCETPPPPLQALQNISHEVSSTRSEPYIIPVLFHVYWDENVAPIATGHIRHTLDIVNEMLRGEDPDFINIPPVFQAIVGNPQIQLQFSTRLPDNTCTSGIIYHYYDFDSFPDFEGDNYIETSRYLNIQVFPATNSFASYPSSVLNNPGDGITFSYWDIINRRETLPHELGHWLNLIHTFGETNQTGGICGNDFVDDTPPTRGSIECNLDLADCNSGLIENVNNYMDYSPCRIMFTQGQVARMHAALEDTSLNRYIIYSPQNLEYTGISEPQACERSIELWHFEYSNCDSVETRYSYLVNGQIPDSVRWQFNSPEISFSTQEMPRKYYYSSGNKDVNLTLYFGEEIETIDYTHEIELNSTQTNLPLIESLPLNLDADVGLLLPNEHINLLSAPLNEGWQICDFAGYQSDKCIYVPARVIDGEAFADIEMGMFDMSGLVEPTISFHVAAALVNTGAFHTIQILFRDECSSVFVGDLWLVRPLYDINNGNTLSGFIPNSDDQWYEVTATFPEWIYSSHGFITIRLKTNMPSNFSGEPFYLDNFRIGDPEIITGIKDKADNQLLLYPNPARNILYWNSSDSDVKCFSVADATGRQIISKEINGNSGNIDISSLNSGPYFLQLKTSSVLISKRFVVAKN
ncbi:MAG: zinc-dependent metalloprotease [Bacteroidia bacterium]